MSKSIKTIAFIVIGLIIVIFIIGAFFGGGKGGSVNDAFQKGMNDAKQTVNGK